jgi:hypothetical protein
LHNHHKKKKQKKGNEEVGLSCKLLQSFGMRDFFLLKPWDILVTEFVVALEVGPLYTQLRDFLLRTLQSKNEHPC